MRFDEIGNRLRRRDRPRLWWGIAGGAAGGLAGAWAMVEFQKASSKILQGKLSRNLEANVPEHREKREAEFSSVTRLRRSEQHLQKEDATRVLGAKIWERIFDHSLTREEKNTAGQAVHYAFGAGLGAFYGGAAEFFPAVRATFGVPFISALFVAADGIMLPAMGWSQHPRKRSLAKHAYGFLTHVVYGIATESVRRAFRKAVSARDV